MQQIVYTFLTDDVDFIRFKLNRGELLDLKLVFDFNSFKFTYKIKYI